MNMFKAVTQKSVWISLLLFALLVTSFTVGYDVHAITLTYSTVIESGSMTSTASYIIFKDGSTYYARNGTTGAIDYSNTNATLMIQNVVDSLTSGGLIFLKTGVYIIDSSINITHSCIHLEGEDLGTELYLADDSDVDMIVVPYGSNDVIISHLYLYGNEPNNQNGNIISVYSQGVRIENNRISNSSKHDIYLARYGSEYAGMHRIVGNNINYANQSGIYLYDVWDSWIESNDVGICYQYNIYAYTIAGCTFVNNNVWGAKQQAAFKLLSSRNTAIINNRIDQNYKTGLWIESCTDILILSNRIYANGKSASDTYYGIYAYGITAYPCNNIMVANNRIGTNSTTEYQQAGLYAVVGSAQNDLSWWIITNNDFQDNISDSYYFEGNTSRAEIANNLP